MVIAEALSKLKDLEKTRGYWQDKITASTFVLPEEKANAKSIDTMIDTYLNICGEIAEIKASIIKTNIVTTVEIADVGIRNLVQLIKIIEIAKQREVILRSLCTRTEDRGSRFYSVGYRSEEPIRLLPNFEKTPDSYRDEADKSRFLARELERILIKTNWQTEIIN